MPNTFHENYLPGTSDNPKSGGRYRKDVKGEMTSRKIGKAVGRVTVRKQVVTPKEPGFIDTNQIPDPHALRRMEEGGTFGSEYDNTLAGIAEDKRDEELEFQNEIKSAAADDRALIEKVHNGELEITPENRADVQRAWDNVKAAMEHIMHDDTETAQKKIGMRSSSIAGLGSNKEPDWNIRMHDARRHRGIKDPERALRKKDRKRKDLDQTA